MRENFSHNSGKIFCLAISPQNFVKFPRKHFFWKTVFGKKCVLRNKTQFGVSNFVIYLRKILRSFILPTQQKFTQKERNWWENLIGLKFSIKFFLSWQGSSFIQQLSLVQNNYKIAIICSQTPCTLSQEAFGVTNHSLNFKTRMLSCKPK